MRLVSAPLDYKPRACALTNRADGEFVDFQVVIDRPEPTHLYLKRDIVERAACLLGMAPGNEVAALRAELDQHGAALAEVKDQMNMVAELEHSLSKEN